MLFNQRFYSSGNAGVFVLSGMPILDELTLPMAKARGFFLQRPDLPRLRLEDAAEVRSPEAFCPVGLVPECPSVPFKAFERMFKAAL